MSESHYQREVEWYETLLTQKSKKIVELEAEIERLRAALHRISLGSQNSGTRKEDLGREARAALEEK